jgi:putative transposase
MVVIAMAVAHNWTTEGWLYVAAVLHLFSRRVVGWSMKAERDASLVMDALMVAVWRRGKADALRHHSGQGSQYASEQFQHLLADNGITCSMSRAGNVRDNSAMESFFSSLKTERTAHKVYRARDEARADVFHFIERFYNPRRRHSALGGKNPLAFDRQAAQTRNRSGINTRPVHSWSQVESLGDSENATKRFLWHAQIVQAGRRASHATGRRGRAPD